MRSISTAFILIFFCFNSTAQIKDTLGLTVKFGVDNYLFSSMIIGNSQQIFEPEPLQLGKGDTLQFVLRLKNPEANSRIKVTISCEKYINETTIEGLLTHKDSIYLIKPALNWNYGMLKEVRNAIFIEPVIKIWLNDKILTSFKGFTEIRAIDECLYSVVRHDGKLLSLMENYMAYIDENNPVVQNILNCALDDGIIEAFDGYKKDKNGVLHQIAAIYYGLGTQGHYFSHDINTIKLSPFLGIDKVVNLQDFGCCKYTTDKDGAILWLSVLKKVGIDGILIANAFGFSVGFYLEKESDMYISISPAYASFKSLPRPKRKEKAADTYKKYLESLSYLIKEDKRINDKYGIKKVLIMKESKITSIY